MCRVRKQKDRSLRQLLQGERIPNVGAAEGCDLLIFKSEQLQRFFVERRQLLTQRQPLITPIPFRTKPRKAVRKRRVIPAPRQPGAVMHQAQGAQRFDQRQFARVEVMEFVVAVHQLRQLAKAILTGRDQGADLASRYFTFNSQPGERTDVETIRR